MKFHFLFGAPLSLAIMQVFGILSGDGEHTAVDNPAEADCIFASTRKELNQILPQHPDAFYCGIEFRPDRNEFSGLPDNVLVLRFNENLLMQFLRHLFPALQERARQAPKTAAPKAAGVDYDTVTPLTFMRSYSVLVVDDTPENLTGATSLLTRAGHQVTTLGTFHEALELLRGGGTKFDAVLLDMRMPVLRFGPLSEEVVNPLGSEPVGLALMLIATAAGHPVAIVTDGNHHRDWVSALFDNLKSAEVNSQKVLFFNAIGKRWDKALAALMEGAEVG